MGMGNIDPLSAGEFLEAVRQLLGPGHGRTVDKDRYDANAALKRRLNLYAHKVMGWSRRRWFRVSALEDQLAPITATRASHLPTRSDKTSTKSSPSSILSTSKKTLLRPSRLARRS